jgi:regulator of replication initiation timing
MTYIKSNNKEETTVSDVSSYDENESLSIPSTSALYPVGLVQVDKDHAEMDQTSDEQFVNSAAIPSDKYCYMCEVNVATKEFLLQRITQLEMQLKKVAEDAIEACEKVLHINKVCEELQLENDRLKAVLHEKCEDSEKLTLNLNKFLTNDQVQRLTDGVKRGRAYTEETIISSISFWFSCGSVGYAHLLNKHVPLPSISTLHKRLGNISFQAGRAPHINELLSRKVCINYLCYLYIFIF